MKRKVRVTGFIVAFTLLLSMVSQVYASPMISEANTSTLSNIILNTTRIEDENIQSTIETSNIKQLLSNKDVIITRIAVNKSAISVSGVNENTTFCFTGTIFESKMSTDEQQIYVADLKDASGIYDVLYFCIAFTLPQSTSLNKTENNSLEIKLYFKDDSGDLVLCEGVTSNFRSITVKDMAPKSNPMASIDGAWFTKVIQPFETSQTDFDSLTEEEIAADPGLSAISNEINASRATNNYTWTGSVEIKSFLVGGETFRFMACPYFDGSIGDVGRNSTTFWTSTLKLSESVTVDGVLSNQYTNIFYLGNIHFEMAAGAITALTTRTIGGRYVTTSQGSIQVDYSAILDVIVDATQEIVPLSVILGWINAISYNGSNAELVDTGFEAFSPNTRSFGIKVEDNVFIYDSSHYISIDVSAESMNNTTAPDNISTQAIVRWSFCVYDSSDDNNPFVREYSQVTPSSTNYTANSL